MNLNSLLVLQENPDGYVALSGAAGVLELQKAQEMLTVLGDPRVRVSVPTEAETVVSEAGETPTGSEKKPLSHSDGGGGGGGGEIDPIILGLLARLPKSGDIWPEAERKLWLQLLEGRFKLIYKDKEAAN